MLSRIFATILLSTLALSAQDTGSAGTGSTIAIFPPPAASYKELQQFLSLSDQQVTSLQAIQVQRDQAVQAIWKQVSDKQNELNQLLQSGSIDYVRMGQLLVEINTAQKQYPAPVEPYRTQALAVLNPQQKAKLQTLTDALNLNIPANEAVALNLVDSPRYPIQILAGADASGAVPPAAAIPHILPARQ
jgi:Spy/CpxP family protein refolding chaperone